MNINWFEAEMLIRQKQAEIERAAREAWKWLDAEPKSPVFMKQQITTATPTVCCATACC